MKLNKDNIIIGIGASILLSGIAAIDTFITNRKLRKAARSVGTVTDSISDTLHRCVIDVSRDGKRMSALSMVTPGLASRNYRK